MPDLIRHPAVQKFKKGNGFRVKPGKTESQYASFIDCDTASCVGTKTGCSPSSSRGSALRGHDGKNPGPLRYSLPITNNKQQLTANRHEPGYIWTCDFGERFNTNL
jgi:hypothetical protein